MKKCGYSFWGYLGDTKYNKDGKIASTPDGNAFYSWCIIRELQKRGYEVTQIMPDRDKKGYEIEKEKLFNSWLKLERESVYVNTVKSNFLTVIDEYIKNVQSYQSDKNKLLGHIKNCILEHLVLLCEGMEFILHEYRMLIPGRNDYDSILDKNWQPDYLIQRCLFEYCCKYNKKLILFDLDYKLDYMVYFGLKNKGCNITIFELGTKWKTLIRSKEVRKVYIPFDFDNINYFSDNSSIRNYNLVYVGNRYERDWCIDKYIPDDLDKCVVYGNWLEGDKDSKQRWPNLYFGHRLQTKNMRDVYVNSIATILLAKKEYCGFEFMTARIIESIFYGTVPLFIEEYGEDVIKRYAGCYAKLLTVSNKKDVCDTLYILRNGHDGKLIENIIEYLRDRLKFMDVKNFVDIIEEVK